MGVFEVTQKQWELVTGENPSRQAGLTRPVESVSYDDIRGSSAGANWPSSSAVDGSSFLGTLRARTGIDAFDLPTEAQWEYACRAGTTTALNNGENVSNQEYCPEMDAVGRYGGNRVDDTTHTTVGSYATNNWGLYDMHGNVGEWCLDWRGVYDAASDTDPVGAMSGTERVLRGGCWRYTAASCRSACRVYYGPSDYGHYFGFRLSALVQDSPMIDSLTECVVSESASSPVRMEIATGKRKVPAGTTIQLTYSDLWDGTDGGTVTITANGIGIFSGAGEGEYGWSTPAVPQTVTLVHADGASRLQAEIIVGASGGTETTTTPVPVPYSWLDDFGLATDGDYEKAARADGANGRPVWESYVLGLVPTDANSRFRALIEMVDGQAKITWTPDLGTRRFYTVEGKEKLSDPAWGPRKASDRFFRVKVEMP